MKTTIKLALAAVIAAGSASVATANDAHHTAQASGPEAKATMSEGEVRKIDKATGKLTIKHGPLDNLGMPPMTMVFKAKDPAMLDQVKVGDKVGFVAEKVNGALTVTELEARK